MRDAEIVAEVQAAEAMIRPYVRETPLERSPFLSELGGADVYPVFVDQESAQLAGPLLH